MQKIILDTNFLMIPAQFGIDIFSEIKRIADFEYRLCILDRSLTELENIVKGTKGRLSQEVKLTLAIVRKNIADGNIEVIPTDDPRHVDSIIADMEGCVVATQDIGLQRRLKENTRVITMRQKKYLVFK